MLHLQCNMYCNHVNQKILLVTISVDHLQDWSQYRIDSEENVILNTDEEPSAIIIPEINNPLSETDFEELWAQVNPVAHDEEYGINLYRQACIFATERAHTCANFPNNNLARKVM